MASLQVDLSNYLGLLLVKNVVQIKEQFLLPRKVLSTTLKLQFVVNDGDYSLEWRDQIETA